MKPMFDLSKSQQFTVWEKGSWSPKDKMGSAVLICGPSGDKLPVIFDKSPLVSNEHYLFFAYPGQFLIGAQVAEKDLGPDYKYEVKVEVSQILSLGLDDSGPEPTVMFEEDSLLVHSFMLANVDQHFSLGLAIQEKYPWLLALAHWSVEKATTEKHLQSLFWGVPRKMQGQPVFNTATGQ